MNPTQEKALRLAAEAGVKVKQLLDAGKMGEAIGIAAEGYGCLDWAPVRPDGDWSRWGAWEAWPHRTCEERDGVAGAFPTGDWIAWHAPSGQQIGFPAPNARRKAEMFAVFHNDGLPTRVVDLDGEARPSALDYFVTRAQVHAVVGEGG